MLERPGAVTAIISQNGNAYEEGLGPFWDSIKPFWVDPAQAREDLKNWLLSLETTKWQVRASPNFGRDVSAEPSCVTTVCHRFSGC